MLDIYTRLALTALLPAAVAFVFSLLEEKTGFGKIKYITRQIIIGIVFGAIAVFGTEFGIPANGAVLNTRDAAPLCAGLLFGGPAGIIAGCIGGIERWFAVYWGVGSFTRIACSVSTCAAGFFAASLRKYMFDDERPSWFLSLASGFVFEVFHITMVFVTNLNQAEKAFEVVKICALPMIIGVAVSVAVSSIFAAAASVGNQKYKDARSGINRIIQKWMFISVLIAFVLTSAFMFLLQNGLADRETEELLRLGISDIIGDIEAVSDANLLRVTHSIADEKDKGNLWSLALKYSVSEINIVNEKGIIEKSTTAAFVGYDMASGEQSASFLPLLSGEKEIVQNYGPISYDESMSRKYAGVVLEDGGFIQVGYNANVFQREIAQQVSTAANNRRVGKHGAIVIIDSLGNIVSGPEEYVGRNSSEWDFDKDYAASVLGTVQTFTVDGIEYQCMFGETEGYFIASLLADDEVYGSRDLSLYLNSFTQILIFGALFLIIFLLIKQNVLDNVKKVNGLLGQITEGDLETVVDVRGNKEFDALSDGINSTVDTLKDYISEAEARIDQELEFARGIQHSALPEVFPAYPNRRDFDIFASMIAAKEVGGDFYDFYLTDKDCINFLVADVSGKGIPAAMFMMRAKTLLKSLRESGLAVSDVFIRGNNGLCEGNDSQMFVTSWMGSVDLNTGLMEFANAGHNPPLVKHADGQFEYLKTIPGLVLGGMENMKYKLRQYQLLPGDIVFLYTDGVTEATDSHNELYGEQRLQTAINSCSFETVEQLCALVKEDVDAFVGEAPQFDDITMLAFKFNGKPPKASISFEEAKIDDITEITAFAEEALEKMECPMKASIQINIAIDEIYSNIVKYAYKDKTGPAWVTIEEVFEPHGALITFTDDGIPYNPMNKEDPDVTLKAEERGIGGLGIFMVKKSMDEMVYEYRNEKNILTVRKNFE